MNMKPWEVLYTHIMGKSILILSTLCIDVYINIYIRMYIYIYTAMSSIATSSYMDHYLGCPVSPCGSWVSSTSGEYCWSASPWRPRKTPPPPLYWTQTLPPRPPSLPAQCRRYHDIMWWHWCASSLFRTTPAASLDGKSIMRNQIISSSKPIGQIFFRFTTEALTTFAISVKFPVYFFYIIRQFDALTI